jgi:ribonuclease HI
MKPKEGISVDGGCSKNPGKAYYRAVDIATGKELFRKDIGVATNNIAEFIGLCQAIRDFPDSTIYSDSVTAISWVKKKKANSSFEFPRLEQIEDWLKTLNKMPKIEKWLTKEWGEIPADFGLK